jgi:hypothetical protein
MDPPNTQHPATELKNVKKHFKTTVNPAQMLFIVYTNIKNSCE